MLRCTLNRIIELASLKVLSGAFEAQILVSLRQKIYLGLQKLDWTPQASQANKLKQIYLN